MKIRPLVIVSVSVWAFVGQALAGFEAGNLVVVRVGDGKTIFGKGMAAPVFLDEIEPKTGSVVRSIAMPTESGPLDRRFILSSSATSEGMLAVSIDGRYLTLAGYDAPLKKVGVTNSASEEFPRIIARVDASGHVDTTTRISDGYARNNVRGAVTVDGLRYYVAGAGKGGGTRLVEHGSSGKSTLLSETIDNTRGVVIFEDQLYASTASEKIKGIVAVGRGIPAEPGKASILNAPAPTAPEPKPDESETETKSKTKSEPRPDQPKTEPVPNLEPKPSGFLFLGGFLYVAEIETGLLVYEPEESKGDGPARYRLKRRHDLPKLASLAGQVVNGKPMLYGTDGERLLRLVVDEPVFRTILIARAGPNQFFRGVAFAPTVFDEPPVSVPVVVGLGLVGLVVPGVTIFAIRRKARRRVRYEGTDIVVEGGPI